MKCSSCGKIFDYEKYYGICPKCGTYNKKQEKEQTTFTSSDPYAEMNIQQEQENNKREQENYQREQDTARNYQQNEYDNIPLTAEEEQAITKRKTAVIVLAVLSAVFVVIAIVIVSVGLAYTNHLSNDDSKQTEVEKGIPQIEESMGQTFIIEDSTQIAINVDSAEVLCDADIEADFPEGEKLVAVLIRGEGNKEDWDYDADLTNPVGNIYIGYDDTFEESVSDYDLEEYSKYTGGKEEFSSYSLKYDDSTGYLYFFVPKEVTDCYLYIEQYDVNTGDLQMIYKVKMNVGNSDLTGQDDTIVENNEEDTQGVE